MLSFVALLVKNWRYVLVFIVLIAGLVYTQLLQHKVTEVSKLNTTLTAQVTTLTTTNNDMQAAYEQRIGNLSSAISLQNKDITNYQNQIAALNTSITAYTTKANETRVTYDQAAQGILTDASLPDTSTCTAAMTYLAVGVKDLKWN